MIYKELLIYPEAHLQHIFFRLLLAENSMYIQYILRFSQSQTKKSVPNLYHLTQSAFPYKPMTVEPCWIQPLVLLPFYFVLLMICRSYSGNTGFDEKKVDYCIEFGGT